MPCSQKYSSNSSNVKPKYFLRLLEISKETPNTFNRFDWGFQSEFGEYFWLPAGRLGLVHTNPFSNEKELFCSVFKKICVHTYRFRIVFARPHYNAVSVWKRCYTRSAHGQMNSTHAHFNISAREIGAKLRPHGCVCPPFWIGTVEWSGARSCLFCWRHRFQIASFSPSILEKSVFKKHRFQTAPLWIAFSNGSVFADRFRRCSVDDSRIRSKTVPFSFENGLVWTGP